LDRRESQLHLDDEQFKCQKSLLGQWEKWDKTGYPKIGNRP
jgi:hypothetical protein